jgi:acyl carrier protein
MTGAEVERMIIETLQELQAGSGEPAEEITARTLPLDDLGFFDSLLAIETTLLLEERLKCNCPEDSVFADRDSAKPLSVAQIAARLLRFVGKAA